jgi:hypothetical protein
VVVVDLLALESIWPGVSTDVELKRTSSLVLVVGVKPLGVACAWARLASAAKRREEMMYMVKNELRVLE